MNNQNNDLFGNMMNAAIRAALTQSLADLQNDIIKRKKTQGMIGTNERRRYLENHHSIQTSVTDKDMLLLQIDLALDVRDMELFLRLTNELKGIGVLV